MRFKCFWGFGVVGRGDLLRVGGGLLGLWRGDWWRVSLFGWGREGVGGFWGGGYRCGVRWGGIMSMLFEWEVWLGVWCC